MDAHWHKTNDQATVGSSILMCNLRLDDEADHGVDSPGCTTEEVCAQFIIIMPELYTKAHKSQDFTNILYTQVHILLYQISNILLQCTNI